VFNYGLETAYDSAGAFEEDARAFNEAEIDEFLWMYPLKDNLLPVFRAKRF
jgi:hypothetical protein